VSLTPSNAEHLRGTKQSTVVVSSRQLVVVQFGYLTIKGYDAEFRTYLLDFPIGK